MVIFSTSGFIGKLSFAGLKTDLFFSPLKSLVLYSESQRDVFVLLFSSSFLGPYCFSFTFPQIAGKQLKCLQSAENMQDAHIFFIYFFFNTTRSLKCNEIQRMQFKQLQLKISSLALT